MLSFSLFSLFSLFFTLHALELKKPEKLEEEYTLEARKALSLTTDATATSSVSHTEDDVKGSNMLSTPKLDKRTEKGSKIPWTAEEEEQLMKLRGEGKSWKELEEYFRPRTWRSLTGKYHRLKGTDTTRNSNPWTAEEDETIFRLRASGVSWKEIAKQMPGREESTVRSHHYYLVKKRDEAPAIARGKNYTDEEKELMLTVGKMDIPWREKKRIYFPDRSIKSLKGLYNNIKPEKESPREAWTPEDDDRLIELLKQGDLKMDGIAQSMGRTMPAIGNRVYFLKNSGRIQPGQYGIRLPNLKAPDYELMREKRQEGLSWEDISRQYIPHRPADYLRRKYEARQKRKAKKEKQNQARGSEDSKVE